MSLKSSDWEKLSFSLQRAYSTQPYLGLVDEVIDVSEEIHPQQQQGLSRRPLRLQRPLQALFIHSRLGATGQRAEELRDAVGRGFGAHGCLEVRQHGRHHIGPRLGAVGALGRRRGRRGRAEEAHGALLDPVEALRGLLERGAGLAHEVAHHGIAPEIYLTLVHINHHHIAVRDTSQLRTLVSPHAQHIRGLEGCEGEERRGQQRDEGVGVLEGLHQRQDPQSTGSQRGGLKVQPKGKKRINNIMSKE